MDGFGFRRRAAAQGLLGFLETNAHHVPGASGLARLNRVHEREVRLDDWQVKPI